MYDIAIVGGGPAGATLARILGAKHKVLLLEKRKPATFALGDGSGKPCGGLIAPDAQNMLARLGLGVPEHALVGPQLFAVRTMDLDNRLERFYQRSYLNVDRQRFDNWLLSLVPPTVTLRQGAVVRTIETNGSTCSIQYSADGESHVETARFLVGADGAFSTVRRSLLASHPNPDTYFSLQEWYRTDLNLPYFVSIFSKEISDFYSWVIPKGQFFILGTAVRVGQNPRERFALLKSKMEECGFNFGSAVRKEGAFILRPTSSRQICLGQGNIALVGEAAGFISPSSAEGISYALRSAVALAESLEASEGRVISEYSRQCADLRLNIFGKNLKSPFMYHTVIRRLVMSSGLLSIPVCGGERMFDGAVAGMGESM